MWNYSGFCTSYIWYRTLLWKLSLLYVLNANYLILFRKVPFLVVSIMSLSMCLGVDWCTWTNTWWFQRSRIERWLFKTNYLFSSVQSKHRVKHGQEGRSVRTFVCVRVHVLLLCVHTPRQSFYQWYCIETLWENIRELPLILLIRLGIQVEASDIFWGPCQWGNLSFLLK